MTAAAVRPALAAIGLRASFGDHVVLDGIDLEARQRRRALENIRMTTEFFVERMPRLLDERHAYHAETEG